LNQSKTIGFIKEEKKEKLQPLPNNKQERVSMKKFILILLLLPAYTFPNKDISTLIANALIKGKLKQHWIKRAHVFDLTNFPFTVFDKDITLNATIEEGRDEKKYVIIHSSIRGKIKDHDFEAKNRDNKNQRLKNILIQKWLEEKEAQQTARTQLDSQTKVVRRPQTMLEVRWLVSNYSTYENIKLLTIFSYEEFYEIINLYFSNKRFLFW
jgi:hypothetical protein